MDAFRNALGFSTGYNPQSFLINSLRTVPDVRDAFATGVPGLSGRRRLGDGGDGWVRPEDLIGGAAAAGVQQQQEQGRRRSGARALLQAPPPFALPGTSLTPSPPPPPPGSLRGVQVHFSAQVPNKQVFAQKLQQAVDSGALVAALLRVGLTKATTVGSLLVFLSPPPSPQPPPPPPPFPPGYVFPPPAKSPPPKPPMAAGLPPAAGVLTRVIDNTKKITGADGFRGGRTRPSLCPTLPLSSGSPQAPTPPVPDN